MSEFKSVDGHDFCASPLPLVPEEERKMREGMRILLLFFHRDDEQTNGTWESRPCGRSPICNSQHSLNIYCTVQFLKNKMVGDKKNKNTQK